MHVLKRAVNVVLASGLMVLGFGVWEKAEALNNPDNMTITVRPSVSYAVAITSQEVQGYDFGTVALGVTTISTLAVWVLNSGTVAEYFSVGVNDVTSGAGVAWTNNGPLAAATTSYQMQGLFEASSTTQPSGATFVGAAKNIPTAFPGTAQGTLLQGSGLGNGTLAGTTNYLWLMLDMPKAVFESAQHSLLLTINGQAN